MRQKFCLLLAPTSPQTPLMYICTRANGDLRFKIPYILTTLLVSGQTAREHATWGEVGEGEGGIFCRMLFVMLHAACCIFVATALFDFINFFTDPKPVCFPCMPSTEQAAVR